MNRNLTSAEERLIRWMLEHRKPEAPAFLPQLDRAQVTPWRCRCGCASIILSIEGMEEPKGGLRILSDFMFGIDEDLCGIFVYERDGILRGLEVYGLAEVTPTVLPTADALRPLP